TTHLGAPEAFSSDGANAVVVQNGKLVLAGGINFEPNRQYGLLRYDSTGRLDASFGTGGVVTTDLRGPLNTPAAAAVSYPVDAVPAHDKIVAAGTLNNSLFAVARYNPDGSLDPTFGNGGQVTSAFPFSFASGQAAAVAVEPVSGQNKIVVAGTIN